MGAPEDESVLRERVAKLKTLGGVAPDLGATIRQDPSEVPSRDKLIDSALPRISLGLGSVVPPAANTDFAVVSTLGEGGMGTVHLAWQRSLARDVAVKTLKEQAHVEVGMELLREARLTGSLEHPGVIPIHALGADENGTPLLVMKRVEGVDFSNLLTESNHPIWAERTNATIDRLAAKLEIIAQVCRTLEFAHARGVIHRDIKPANIMVGRYGEVYLLDWGIAFNKKDGRARGIVGTPGFMAPEMFLGGVVDERTDVYLLGATLHNAITGARRHEGVDMLAVGKASLASAPFAYGADVPPMLAEICNRATARDPENRPESVQRFRELITDFLQHRSAMILSAAARKRLGELRMLMDGSAPGQPPTDLGAAYRLATEARFGFAQCLADHPTHADAIQGAREGVISLVELELRQGHADSADAILRELDAKDEARAALVGRIAEVRAQDETRAKEAARLEALDHDRNPNIGLGPRALLFAFTALMIVAISFVAPNKDDAWTEVLITSIAIILTLAVSVMLKNWLFKTAYNRSIAGLFYVALALWLINKIACALRHDNPEATFATDLWITAAALSAGALTVERKLWASAAPLVIGGVAIRFLPNNTHPVFSIAMFSAVAVTGVVLWIGRGAKKSGTTRG